MQVTNRNANTDCSVHRRSHSRYTHTIRAIYHCLGLASEFSDTALHLPSFADLSSASITDRLEIAMTSVKRRLTLVDPTLTSQLLSSPWLREVTLLNKRAFIPIINAEGRDWYSESLMLNFDFFVESFCGMHQGAEVIYDIGGHQGVWALFYSMCIPPTGRVYTFEPSIVNLECAALSFLLNDVSNAVIVPFGIGGTNTRVAYNADGLLIGGIKHDVVIQRLDHVLWEKPDFMKIDIEGYEHELLEGLPSLFDICRNMHLEVHIPHLEARGIDYRDIMSKIPFDRVRVRRAIGQTLYEINKGDELSGFCTLLITPRD